MESNAALDVGREYDSQIINWSNQNVSTIEFQMHFSEPNFYGNYSYIFSVQKLINV